MTTKWKSAKDWYQLLFKDAVIEEGEDKAAEFCIKAQQLGHGALVQSITHPHHGYEPFGFWYSPSDGDIAWRAEYDRRKPPVDLAMEINYPFQQLFEVDRWHCIESYLDGVYTCKDWIKKNADGTFCRG